jgi:hypothetical protein
MNVVTKRHDTGLHASPNSQVESIVWGIMGQIFQQVHLVIPQQEG